MLVEHEIAHRPAILGAYFRAVAQGFGVISEVANAVEAARFEVSINRKRRRCDVVDFVACSGIAACCDVADTMHFDGIVMICVATDHTVRIAIENLVSRFSSCGILKVGASWGWRLECEVHCFFRWCGWLT